MTERVIPESTTPGRRTPTFTPDTVPAALLGLHHTTVWAELLVEAGSVEFREAQAGGDWVATARPGEPVVIVPERRHRVVPSEDARFHVRFHDWVD